VPAPPGTTASSAVVVDVEETGSLTPLLDKLLFDPDVAKSSPSRREFPPRSGSTTQTRPTQLSRMADTGSITQASIARMWQRKEPR
jgi:hypothetical protein